MSATLDYDLKQCMGLLCKDSRWNVLTVLILHANIRNRCFVGMDTIAEMATSGNLAKATRAKKWLDTHGVYELVPYDKRVGEERELPKRQHVYQLTGTLHACAELDCECQKWLKKPKSYLHYGKTVPMNVDVIPIENIRASDVIPIENITHPNVIPIENFNGRNLSTTNKSITTTTTTDPITEATNGVVAADENDSDIRRVYKAYENNIGQLTPMIAEDIKDALKDSHADWLIEGMVIAVRQNTRKWAYVRAILDRWHRDGKSDRASPNSKSPIAGLKFITADESEIA